MSEAKWEPKRWAPTMRESAHGDWVDLEDALEAIEARDQRVAALEAEVARLRKLFDDAGQGEHNVLALVDHYQAEAIRADERADALKAEREQDTTRFLWLMDADLESIIVVFDRAGDALEGDESNEAVAHAVRRAISEEMGHDPKAGGGS